MMLRFIPWRRFEAFRDKGKTRDWLRSVQRASTSAFRAGMLNGPHTGRIYARRGGRFHQASAPGEYPARDTGGLVASLRSQVTGTRRVVIGTNQFYSIFLRMGTSKMARRRMSDDALQEGIAEARGQHEGFVRFRRRQSIRAVT